MFWNNRKRPQGERGKLQVVGGKEHNPTPTTPGAVRYIPREEREIIAHAFFTLGRSIYWLSANRRMPFRDIEAVIREHNSNIVLRLKVAEILRRAA